MKKEDISTIYEARREVQRLRREILDCMSRGDLFLVRRKQEQVENLKKFVLVRYRIDID